MPYSNMFRVPSYYKSFQCKGKECRSTCCKGWDVSISMQEYFKTQSLPCSKKLRKILDKTFYIPSHANPNRYAIISKNENNDCPLHMENGYCMLHSECGEKSLPSICRYYPRSTKVGTHFIAACANSCEKVIEILISNEEKIEFESSSLTFDMTMPTTPLSLEERKSHEAIFNLCILMMENREMFLPRRIVLLGRILQGIQKARKANQEIDYESFCIDFSIKDYKIEKNIPYSFDIQKKMLLYFSKQSPSIQPYCKQVFNNLGTEDELKNYLEAKNHFHTLFKNPEVMFEKLLINHLIFVHFPFSPKYETLFNEFESLCGVFMFIRFLSICYMKDKSSVDDFVDVMSAAFRLIDHTSFDRNVALLLRAEGVTSLDQLAVLIQG